MKAKHKGINGIHIWVYKRGRIGYTTIYIPGPTVPGRSSMLEEFEELCEGNRRTLTSVAREVSFNLTKPSARSWSASVIRALGQRLRERADPVRVTAYKTARAQATLNNDAWTIAEAYGRTPLSAE